MKFGNIWLCRCGEICLRNGHLNTRTVAGIGGSLLKLQGIVGLLEHTSCVAGGEFAWLEEKILTFSCGQNSLVRNLPQLFLFKVLDFFLREVVATFTRALGEFRGQTPQSLVWQLHHAFAE